MKNIEFLEKVNALIGNTYNSCDCKDVIAKAVGIRFSGTNWLFRSINNSSKYRYLTERHVCGDGTTPPPGAVTFKVHKNKTPKGYNSPPDAYHCGVVDEDGYVIHSSPKTGVRKDLSSKWTDWDYWGLLKHVDYQQYNDLYYGDCDGNDSNINQHDQFTEMTERQMLIDIYSAVVRD